jgi:putative aldouronate transport system substrate-binding protein
MHDAAGVNYFIPTATKYPQAALRYLNWLARFENYNFLQIGPAGVTHDLGSDGIPRLKAGAGLWIQNSPQNIDYTPMINGLDLGDPVKTAKGLATSYTVDAQLIVDANALSLKNGKPMPIVPATLSAAGPYAQTLADKGNVLLAEAITCAPAQFDRVWDAGIADWLASGGTAIRDERIAKYIAP